MGGAVWGCVSAGWRMGCDSPAMCPPPGHRVPPRGGAAGPGGEEGEEGSLGGVCVCVG